MSGSCSTGHGVERNGICPIICKCFTLFPFHQAAPDLDGGRPGAQAWWEAPCADTESLGREGSMKSLVFPWIVNIYDVHKKTHNVVTSHLLTQVQQNFMMQMIFDNG